MLRNNKINLLISIVFAIALWAYITTVVNPDTERTIDDVSVGLINVDALNDRGFTVADGPPTVVDVIVTGPRSEVLALAAADFRVTADMTGYHRGVQTVPVHVVVPGNIELVQARPDSVQVEVVDMVTVYKPVRLEFEEDFPMGEEAGFVEITPNEMEVSGVAAAVDSVDHIRAMVMKDTLTEEITTQRIDVVAINDEGEPVYNVGLSQNSVELTAAHCKTKVVPFSVEFVGEAPASIEVTNMYTPRFITIRGATDVVENIKEIEGGTIDLSTIRNTEVISVESYLTMPEGVEVADASKNLTIRIEVQGIAREEFEFTGDEIEIENLPKNVSAYINTASVTVTVFASQDILDGITKRNLRIYVDAEDRWRGESSLELEVLSECDMEVHGITIEPSTVRAAIIRDN